MKYNLTREGLEEAVIKCESFADVCRALGIKNIRGGSYERVKCRIKEFNIDTSHFLGQAVLAGKRNPACFQRKHSNEEILSKGKVNRVSHKMLKRALLESGIHYKCKNCLLETWLDKTITLEVDHINGDWSNCLIENLRFLCPNCHSQTPTYGMKNKKSPGNAETD